MIEIMPVPRNLILLSYQQRALQAFFLHMRAYIFIFTISNVNLHKKELPTTPALVIP